MRKQNVLFFLSGLAALFFFTSQQRLDNTSDFLSDSGSSEILRSYQGKRNVLKTNGSKTQWSIVRYPLTQYKGKLITIEITADVRREGAAGSLNWQVNNAPDYPSASFIENASTGVWHSMRGRLIVTPEDNDPHLYLTNWENNSRNTVYYIADPIITITEGDSLTPDFSLTPLKTIYENDFLIGNIMGSPYLTGKYLDILKHHYNIVTSTATYPIQLAPSNKGGSYQYAYADSMLSLAEENNIPVHGHVLVWHEASPAWLTEGSREEVIKNMNNHITTVLSHFKGRIKSWDVVNEAIRDNLTSANIRRGWKNCVRNTQNPWFSKLGADYIELAFRFARAADPDITLYYNDFGLENPNKAEAVRMMIQDINDRYKKETGGSRNLIEGVGSQAHIYDLNLNMDNVRASLEKLISLGIETAITELDISTAGYVRGNGMDTVMQNKDETAQAVLYARLMSLYREYSSSITRVTFWGIDDGTSWISAGNPAVFDWKLNAKQAFHAVSDPDGFLRQHGDR